MYFMNAFIRSLWSVFSWLGFLSYFDGYVPTFHNFNFCQKDTDKCGYGEQGRKEILSLLNRRKYKEMLMSSLEKTRLRSSPLDVRFHLRDLIGSGHVKVVHTPTGLLVRVSTD
jgi:hypothetical protein